jgi:acyl-CoA synthetase (NDP forming)
VADAALAAALFAPRAVAIVGASADPAKNTARPQRFLRRHGYAGRIVPVNPQRAEVLGERAVPSLCACTEPVDHVMVMVPAAQVPGVVEECVAKRVPVASIFSDGFAEAGPEGRRRQEAIVRAARAGGVRLLGPNSLGVVDVHARVALSANAVLEMETIPRGHVGVVSQSGTILGTMISRGAARGVGFSRLASVGNEADLSVGEIVGMLVDDPNTRVILLFLETLRDAVTLAQEARRAWEAGKPVVAYKLGRSAVGQALAVSHTGAIAGEERVADAFFAHHGILRVDQLETLIEIPALVAGRRPAGGGRRVSVVSTTGGGAATVADRLGALGLEVVAAPEVLVRSLAAEGIAIGRGPVIDMTLAGTSEAYATVLAHLLASAHCDAVLAVVGSSAQFHPQLAVEPIVRAGRASLTEKPLAAFLLPDAPQSLALLAAAGVPAFRTPESCADALAAFLRWRAPAQPGGEVALPQTARAWLDTAQARVRAEPARAGQDTRHAQLDERASLALLAALGLDVAPSQVLRSASDPLALPGPWVAKILSPDIAHKTDAGGVATGLATPDAVREAFGRLQATVSARAPRARIEGVLVQTQIAGLAEAIVGYRLDPQAGPVVSVGLGGTLAEIYRDVALRLAPVDEAAALAMIAEVRGLAVVRGFRGLPRGDVAALARAVARLSRLALDPLRRVAEAEANPVIVRAEGEGAIAVDALVVLARDGAESAADASTVVSPDDRPVSSAGVRPDDQPASSTSARPDDRSAPNTGVRPDDQPAPNTEGSP